MTHILNGCFGSDVRVILNVTLDSLLPTHAYRITAGNNMRVSNRGA